MAHTTVETTIQGIAGRIAALCQLYAVDGLTGTSYWTRVDAAADETFENRLKGTVASEFDERIRRAEFAANSASGFFQKLRQYFTDDLSLAGISAYLTAQRWRVPQEFAEWWYQQMREGITAANIIPREDPDRCGTMTHGSAFVAGTDFATMTRGHPNTTDEIAGLIEATVPVGTTIGVSAWALDITVDYEAAAAAATYDVVNLAITNGAVAGTKFQIGAQLLSGNEDAAQTILGVAATGQFSVGGRILVYDDSSHEVATVESIVENVSVTVTSGLLHSYTTAANAAIQPMFIGVSACATDGATGEAGDEVTFGVNADYSNAV